MITPRWRKILRDLWSNKTRTLLVVLSIAVGVASIGMVAGTYTIISRELPRVYQRVNPASATIFASPFDDELLQVLRRLGLAEALEGRYTLRLSIKGDSEKETDLYLTVVPDFNNILVNKIYPESGAWPPAKGELLIERSALSLIKARVGDRIMVETPDGRLRNLKLSGLAHDLTKPAGTFTNRLSGFITFDTLEYLGYPREYNELLMTVNGNPPDRDEVNVIANNIAEKIRKSGRTVFSIVLTNPGRLWFETFVSPMTSILGILGLIILLMSSLLVVNTISALISQQIRQIGVMKAVGGRTSQITAMYLVSMLIVGIIALIIAIPLGALWTRGAVGILAQIINFDITNYQISIQVILLQTFLSLVVPVISAMIPIYHGARVTVREAISDYGLTRVKFGGSLIDRFISEIRGLPRPVLLSLRNTFRQKVRLSLTLITLAIGSAIFIAVISVYFSLTNTLDQALRYYNFDLLVQLNRPYRIEQISNALSSLAGVSIAETWDAISTRILLPDGTQSDNMVLIAPTKETKLIKPTILEGRWLEPGDEDAVVINTDVLRLAPDVKLGDSITLNIEEKESTWKVVGIIRSVLSGPTAFTNYSYYSRVLGRFGSAGSAYIKVQYDDPEFQRVMASLTEDHFERLGLRVGAISTVAELRSTAIQQYNVIFVFLILMAILLTVVGGLGLTGTMSLNILERTRELGVIRAVGASNGAVTQIVIIEGIVIGILSWSIGIILAAPLTWILGAVVGSGFLQEPLPFSYSVNGALVWFFVVIALASMASYFPSRKAVRLTVRDVLAYE